MMNISENFFFLVHARISIIIIKFTWYIMILCVCARKV